MTTWGEPRPVSSAALSKRKGTPPTPDTASESLAKSRTRNIFESEDYERAFRALLRIAERQNERNVE